MEHILNDHSWYKIDTVEDIARSVLWISENLTTAISYFLIPNEINHWSEHLDFPVTKAIAIAFIGFIVFCGLHHIVDVVVMPTAPWWAILSVNLPMALFSVATAVYLRKLRKPIMSVLDAISKDFR